MGDELNRADWPQKLRLAGLRPTRQRQFLASLLFGTGKNRHVTAEILFAEAQSAGQPISLATVYNTLHHFAEAGLIRPLKVAPDRIWYDTRTDLHHHFYYVEDGRLVDITADQVAFAALPAAPHGTQIEDVEVVIRVAPENS